MEQDIIRQKLIDGTIRVIAREGLDKASTKQIGLTASVNEAYIYRCFKDKEDMFACTFSSLDNELITVAMHHVSFMDRQEVEYSLRCREFFNSVWAFLLGNRDKCLAFIRYYYSPLFLKYSAKEHKKRYCPLVARFENAFYDEANVWMILNHILSTMLTFAVKVYNGDLPDDEDTQEHVFRLVYVSVQQYFKIKE